MTYLVNITDIAERDILSAVKYIAGILNSPAAANNLLDEIERHEVILESTPKMYPLVYDECLAARGLRFVMIKKYILFYTVNEDEKQVNVVRFLHSRRNWKNILVTE